MTRFVSAAVALATMLTVPLSTDAQPHGGGPRGGGGGPRGGGGGAPHAAAPAARPAPPAARPAGGGFNLGNDVRPPNSIAPVRAPERPPVVARPPAAAPAAPRPQIANRPADQRQPAASRPVPGRRPPGGYPPRPPQPAGGYAPRRPPHTVIGNPVFHGRPWGWNGGTVWSPAQGYYGGGFWGAFAISAAAAFAYGSIDDGGQTYVSYGVAPGSPGAQLLANYQLTQTDCDQQDLVVIYGPDQSVICAYPSDLVAPGNYTVDPSGLSISSE